LVFVILFFLGYCCDPWYAQAKTLLTASCLRCAADLLSDVQTTQSCDHAHGKHCCKKCFFRRFQSEVRKRHKLGSVEGLLIEAIGRYGFQLIWQFWGRWGTFWEFILTYAHFPGLCWYCCTDLGGLTVRTYARYVVTLVMLCDLVLFILFPCCFPYNSLSVCISFSVLIQIYFLIIRVIHKKENLWFFPFDCSLFILVL